MCNAGEVRITNGESNGRPSLRLANTQEQPRRETGDFIMTETAHDVYRSLDLVRKIGGPAMTMIAGIPGAGESEAVMQYAAEHYCVYIQAVKGEGTPWSFAHSLGDLWG